MEFHGKDSIASQEKSISPGDPRLELVVNVPANTENELSVPGVRDTADVWTEMIKNAHHSIDFEEFYLNLTPQERNPKSSRQMINRLTNSTKLLMRW